MVTSGRPAGFPQFSFITFHGFFYMLRKGKERHFMRRELICCFLLLAAITPVASAIDGNPPSWRGMPGTTLTIWEFGDSSTTPTPDYQFNPYGLASINIVPGEDEFGNPKGWLSEVGDFTGVWPLSGDIYITIVNAPESNPYKVVRMQITWGPEEGIDTLTIDIDAGSSVVGDMITIASTDLGDGWTEATLQWVIQPNSLSEEFHLYGNAMVSDIVIDTWCTDVPEPATLSILAIGGLAMLKRRRAG